IYVQTASKDLFLSGGRFSWVVASPALRAQFEHALMPFAVPPAALMEGYGLLKMPDALSTLRAHQSAAHQILSEGIGKLGLQVRDGRGPWVLVNLGAGCDAIIRGLSDTFNIDVQPQTGMLAGWARISATMPCQAERLVSALTALVTFFRAER